MPVYSVTRSESALLVGSKIRANTDGPRLDGPTAGGPGQWIVKATHCRGDVLAYRQFQAT